MVSGSDNTLSTAVATCDAGQRRGDEDIGQRRRYKDIVVRTSFDDCPVVEPREASFSVTSLQTSRGTGGANEAAEKLSEFASDIAAEPLGEKGNPDIKRFDHDPRSRRKSSSGLQAISTATNVPSASSTFVPKQSLNMATLQEAPKESMLSLCTLPNEILDMILDCCLNKDLPSPAITINTSISLSVINKKLRTHVLEWFHRQELTVRVEPLLEEGLTRPLALPLLRQVKRLRVDFSGLTYKELAGNQQALDDLRFIWGSGSALERIGYLAPLDYQELDLQPVVEAPRVVAMRCVAESMERLAQGLGFGGELQWEPDYTGAVNKFDQTAVLAAVDEGKEHLVRYIINQPYNGLETACGGLTPLYMAVLNEDVQMTKLLLETKRVNVNAVNRHKLETSLSVAIRLASHQIVKLLLETGEADITTPRGVEARTPMKTAELYYEEDMVDMLHSHLSHLSI